MSEAKPKTASQTGTRPPPWMKVPLPFDTGNGGTAGQVKSLLRDQRLHTVCEEASCPNLGHCWSRGTATFMIMGAVCTRRCGFCDVATGKPRPLDAREPERIAASVTRLGLKHAVITSVDRDDLPDCGSAHFAAVIRALRQAAPKLTVEVLIPDFKGRVENLERIWDAGPDVLNHNVETVPALFSSICPQSRYDVSLEVLRLSAERGFMTKSGIILGLGETVDQVTAVLDDLRENGVRLVTIGQYLQPTPEHTALKEYVPPEIFRELGEYARALGFAHVESGPLVRSSYHAGETVAELSRSRNPEMQHEAK